MVIFSACAQSISPSGPILNSSPHSPQPGESGLFSRFVLRGRVAPACATYGDLRTHLMLRKRKLTSLARGQAHRLQSGVFATNTLGAR